MKSKIAIRCGHAIALFLAGMLATSPSIIAQAKKSGPEGFTATSANVAGAGDMIRIDLLRWSTEAERNQIFTALSAKGEKELAAEIQKAQTLGYLWTSESAGYSLRYAVRIETPGGGERIIVVTDRPIGSWEPRLWAPAGGVKPMEYPFSVVELRLSKTAPGEGKTSLTAKVMADKDAKTIALDNYAAAPVMLKGVKRNP